MRLRRKIQYHITGGEAVVHATLPIAPADAQRIYNARSEEDFILTVESQCNGDVCCTVRKHTGELLYHRHHLKGTFQKLLSLHFETDGKTI